MSRASRFFVVGVLAGILVPAAVVMARGFDPTETFSVNTSTYTSVGPQATNDDQFQPLGDLRMSPVGLGANITLSAEMTQGKARFRFVSEDFDPRPLPIPADGVVFTGPGANSYGFFDRDSCGNFSVEWARVGNKKAKLSQASLQAYGDATAC